ncbi:Auxin-responsive protein SAUR67 [Vitis vinifera]|uniref:Auxin-responsive protein SAUR67 n=1 Tax=Vitis vinifera TaxID=29760 RepID=A0A438JTJ9_VITVI|nr:Auxin-responsive protein SAUR67 [Vitis vinifera]
MISHKQRTVAVEFSFLVVLMICSTLCSKKFDFSMSSIHSIESQEASQNGKEVAEDSSPWRKTISSPRTKVDVDADNCSTSVADKGHFVVYTTDKRRFMIPLAYLSNNILRELFKMAEEEFGLQSNGPITLPCDSVFMEYILPLIQRGVAKDVEKALLFSLATSCCSLLSSHQEHISQQLLVCSY